MCFSERASLLTLENRISYITYRIFFSGFCQMPFSSLTLITLPFHSVITGEIYEAQNDFNDGSCGSCRGCNRVQGAATARISFQSVSHGLLSETLPALGLVFQ